MKPDLLAWLHVACHLCGILQGMKHTRCRWPVLHKLAVGAPEFRMLTLLNAAGPRQRD